MSKVRKFKAQGSSSTVQDVDPTLTPNMVEIELMKLAPLWDHVGEALGISHETLLQIAIDDVEDHSRLSAVIHLWMLKSQYCTWERVRDTKRRLSQRKYTEILQKRTAEGHKKEYEFQILLEAEPDVLNKKVSQADLKDIEEVLRKHCPLKWHQLGLQLLIPKHILDVINANHSDIYMKLIEMLSTWINADKTSTWRELVTALEKLEENKAAHAIEEVYADPIVPPQRVGRPAYNNSTFDDRREEQWQKKEPIMKELRGLLKVRRSVTDEELIKNMGDYIRKAKLNETDLKRLVRTIEALQVCMTESSTILRKWATALKHDFWTARTIKKKIRIRLQDLEKIQKRLERNKEILQEYVSSFDKKTFFQKLIRYNMHQEKLITEEKLKFVHTELQQSMQDLEWANADYEAIGTKLHYCQIELEACVEEMRRLNNAISSSGTIIVKFLRSKLKQAAGIGGGAVVGAAIGAIASPVGLVIGALTGGFLGFIKALEVPQEEEFEKLVKSCVSEIDKTNREIDDIRHLLNEADCPFNTP